MTLKEKVVEARKDGYSYSQIKKEFGVAKSTSQDWVRKANEEVAYYKGFGYSNLFDVPVEDYTSVPKITPVVNPFISRDRPKRFNKNEEEVLDFLEQLAPINVSPSYYGDSVTELTDYAVVGSDFHFGCHDEPSINIFLEVIRQIKPRTIILNGDTMDFLAISKYPKDIHRCWSLQDERIAYHSFLDNLIEVAGGADIYETVSNHSGQSVDGRWRRYLSERLGELSCLPDIADKLSYENIFMGTYQDFVSHVDYVALNDLIVTHGTTVRKNGGQSARGEIDKWHTSILHGHTHRIGSSCQRVPTIAGRPEQQLIGIEGGCLCNLDPVYGSNLNWQKGFNIISLGNETFGCEQVYIKGNAANISTLGKTIWG